MLDSLFVADLEQIKMRAAADEIRRDTTYQDGVREMMSERLDGALDQLIGNQKDNLQLGDEQLEVMPVYNVASGSLHKFVFNEPKEQFELEEDFAGNVQEILTQQRLQDKQEIDMLLEKAVDPFGEVEEDEDESEANVIANIAQFLGDLRDAEKQSKQQELYLAQEKAATTKLNAENLARDK